MISMSVKFGIFDKYKWRVGYGKKGEKSGC